MTRTFPWIVAGVGAGIATWLVMRQPTPQYATGSDTVEGAAANTAAWGDRQRVAGAGSNVLGKVKEGFGNLTGNDRLANEGAADQMEGGLRDAAGKVANAAGQTLHDLNL